jgi:hypothetical protein
MERKAKIKQQRKKRGGGGVGGAAGQVAAGLPDLARAKEAFGDPGRWVIVLWVAAFGALLAFLWYSLSDLVLDGGSGSSDDDGLGLLKHTPDPSFSLFGKDKSDQV